MSGKQDDWQYSKPSANVMHVQESNETTSKEKGDYYNLSVATFTFGNRQADKIMQAAFQENEKDKEKGSLDSNNLNVNFRKNHTSLKRVNIPEEKEMSKDKTNEIKNRLASRIIENNAKVEMISINSNCTFLNKIGSHNTFLGVVVHTIWNMKLLRNSILNETLEISEKDIKTKFLWHLRNILIKYPDKKIIDITKLRHSLADLYQNRRKFLIDQPDDPVDCYFAVINSIHSHYMKTSPCEVNDDSCREKCPSHKFLWIDLARVEECECSGVSKRLFSNHHYIFDIPLDKIFELCSNTNLVEMNKSFKLKTGNFSQVGTSELFSVGDLKGKLFLYFKMLLNQIKGECPINSTRCKLNKTQKVLFLANNPSYLAFSLQRENIGTSQAMSISDNLKTFALIPKIFDLSTLFEYSNKQKIFFEFFGCIMIKPSKTYTCVFKSLIGTESSWVYYDDEKVTSFANSMDFISCMLKNGDTPMLIFYHIQEKYSDTEQDISVEEFQILERYARNADNLGNFVQNRIRINEDIIKYDMMRQSLEGGPLVNTLVQNGNPKRNNNTSSKTSTSISTSKNNSMNNNSTTKLDQINEYACYNCSAKNRIECLICLQCGSSNEEAIEDVLRKRQVTTNVNMNAIREKKEEERSAMNSRKTASMKKGEGTGNAIAPVNPFSKVDSNNNHHDEDELENEEESHGKCKGKNINMPKQMVPKKDSPIPLKNDPAKAGDNSSLHNKQLSKKTIGYDDKSSESISSQTFSPDKPKSSVKNQVFADDVTTQYEDRIRPIESKKNNQNNSPMIKKSALATPENWICDTCTAANKAYEYKCKCCKTINSLQMELIENIISNNHKSIDKAKEVDYVFNPPNSNASSNFNTIKSPVKKTEKKPPHQEKTPTDKKDTKVNEIVTNYNDMASNQNVSSTLKRPPCICYTNYNESVIRNNVCTICNRHVDYVVAHENTIKKRYQQEVGSKPSIAGNTNSTTNMKNSRSKPNIKKDDNSPNNQALKVRLTPSIQGNNGSKKAVVSHMRYNYIDTAEDESRGVNSNQLQGNVNNNLNNYHPFPIGIKSSKVTQLENEGQYNSNQYKSNPNPNPNRMQSTTKKKSSESSIGQHNIQNPKMKK